MTTLPTTQLGRTGMHVTRTGFGASAIGGGDWAFAWGNQDDAASAVVRPSGDERTAAVVEPGPECAADGDARR